MERIPESNPEEKDPKEKIRELDEPPSRPEMQPIPDVENIYSENPYLERYIELAKKALNEDPFKVENIVRTIDECNKVIFKDNFVVPYLELGSIDCKYGRLRRFYFPASHSIKLGFRLKE